MRPLRLLLDGFGCYRQPAEADFSDVDFFALTGPTGSGKSTLIDGLCFALYGTVPRWGKENVIAQALAPAANACRVGLVFEAAGKRYAAVRALARDKRGQVHTKEARLELLDPAVAAGRAARRAPRRPASSTLAEGPDQVKARVQDILGLDLRALHPVGAAAAGPVLRVPAGRAAQAPGAAGRAAGVRRLQEGRAAGQGAGQAGGRTGAAGAEQRGPSSPTPPRKPRSGPPPAYGT